MTFRVGQEVVCVDDVQNGQYMPAGVFINQNMDGLTKGKKYTIRAVFADLTPHWPGVGVYLVEINRKIHTDFDLEIPFCASRFRPIVKRKRKTSIAIFKKMLSPSPSPIKIKEKV